MLRCSMDLRFRCLAAIVPLLLASPTGVVTQTQPTPEPSVSAARVADDGPNVGPYFNWFGCWHPTSTITYRTTGASTNWASATVLAAATWTNSTQVTLNQVSTGGRIVVTSANYPTSTWSGQAPGSTTCSGNTYDFGDASIRFNERFDYYSSNAEKSLAMHEWGHAMGLAHKGTTTTPCDDVVIMNGHDSRRFFDCGKINPTQDDKNGINYLY